MRLFLPNVILFFVLAGCGGSSPSAATPEQSEPPSIKAGEALIAAGRYAAAAELFEAYLNGEPDSPEAHYYLGLARGKQGDAAAALAHYRRAVEIAPDLLEARNNLGLLLAETGALAEAEVHFRYCLKKESDRADTHYNYALVLEAQGRDREAGSHYEKAAAIDPGDPAPWIGLGDLARRAGELAEALRCYRAARQIAPDNSDLVLLEGQILLRLKRVDEAVRILTPLSGAPEIDPRIAVTAGVLLAKYDQSDAAIKLYETAISRDKGYAEAHFLLANALARNGRFAEAASHYGGYLRLSPDGPEAAVARKRLDICKKQMEGAAE